MTRYRTALLSALALACALLVAYVDAHTDDTQFPAFMLLAFTFILSFHQPHLAWWWALLIGLGIPLSHILASAGLFTPQFSSDVSGLFLPVIFACAGASAGALLRRAALTTTQE